MSIPVVLYGVAAEMGGAVAPLLGPEYEGEPTHIQTRHPQHP